MDTPVTQPLHVRLREKLREREQKDCLEPKAQEIGCSWPLDMTGKNAPMTLNDTVT